MSNNSKKKPFFIICELWNENGTLHRAFKVNRESQEGREKVAKSAKWAHYNKRVFVSYSDMLETASNDK